MSIDWKSTRNELYEIIYEADTKAGKWFDIILLIFIILSVVLVMLDSIPGIHQDYQKPILIAEWIFTIFFTIEYILRLILVRKPWKYALSFYGIVDLLAIIPTYASLIFVGSNSLIVIRALRLLRIFRIFKLGGFMRQANIIVIALRNSRSKIFVFMYFILLMVIIIGSSMYFIEGGVNPSFDTIPRSIYWAIVTLTTVGYGDITPITHFGQFVSAIVMILGYSVIAVPTGIVSAELIDHSLKVNRQACPSCSREGHDNDAKYCKFCGETLGNMN